jgi:leucyl aminopeptidase
LRREESNNIEAKGNKLTIMDFHLQSQSLAEAAATRTPALLVLVADGFRPARDALSRLIGKAIEGCHFMTKTGKLLGSYGVQAIEAERVLLAGIGDGSPAQVRSGVAVALAALKGGPAKSATLCFAQTATPSAVAAAVVAAEEATYFYGTTKSKDARELHTAIGHVVVTTPQADGARAAFDQAVAVAKGVRLAREWANRPANYATPTLLGDAARALAKLARIHCEVMGPKEVAKIGMGAFQAVAQGSAQELRFIVLRYTGAAKSQAPVVLVGKGITFDSGGISLKPGPEMDEMKFDMSGAASVLGVFRALADLRPSLNVVGLIPACENLPDGRALKPGDVVTSLSGQTIEILNTDAEGRLILCDALTYAERLQPRAVIDIATLTGACAIALGGVRSGLFANDDPLAAALQAAGERALDPCWRMPLDDDYAEGLKSNFADVANVAGRPAGAVTAAKFLQRFAKASPWAHLDIAGTAWKSGAAKGATGRPVGLLLQYLLEQAEQTPSLPARKTPPKISAARRG